MDSTITEYFRTRRTATPIQDGTRKKLVDPTQQSASKLTITPTPTTTTARGKALTASSTPSIAPPRAAARRKAEPCVTPVKAKLGPTLPLTPTKRLRKHAPDPDAIHLPERYVHLLDTFKASDLLVAMIHNRREVCTFLKLRNCIERQTKKAFNMLRLAQIMTVLPNAYHLRYDYSLPDNRSHMEMQSPTGRTHKLVIEIKVDDNQVRPRHLEERRNLFRESLEALTKNPDKDPLMQPEPLEIEGYTKVPFTARRKLNFDSVLKDDNDNEIQPATPKKSSIAKALFTPPTTPIKSSAPATPMKSLDAPGIIPLNKDKLSPSPMKISAGPLRGISCTLLDRIRSKEQEANNTEATRKRELLATLPELTRTIHTFFTSEKKECLPFDKVVNRCVSSSAMSVTASTICESIDLLLEIVPKWISTIKITRGRYMRLNREHNLTYVHETISNYKIES